MNAPKLKPCPFCGGKGNLTFVDPRDASWVRCTQCLTEGPYRNSGEEAIAAWNRREPDWERKWSELVETTGRRIAESEKGKG